MLSNVIEAREVLGMNVGGLLLIEMRLHCLLDSMVYWHGVMSDSVGGNM